MRHHLEPLRTNGVYDLSALLKVRDFEFLLKKDRCLLIGGFNDARHEKMIRRRRRWMQERKKIDWLDDRYL